MKTSVLRAGAVLLFLLFAVFPTQNILASEDEEKKPAQDCCFENAGYRGQCRVTPAEDETCQSILEYLNTAGTANKTYCGGTRTRGGWTLVECEKKEEGEKEHSSAKP